MAKRKKKKTGRVWNPGGLFAAASQWKHASAAVWAVLGISIITGWAVGVPRLETYVSEQPYTGPVDIRFVESPAWMNGDLEAFLVLTAQDSITPDALNQDDLARAKASLLATGWFQSIEQLRRTERASVIIDATFVQPYAVIRDREGDHLVDPKGRLLPRSVPTGHAAQFTAISGATLARPARFGIQWPGGDVTAALQLKRLIDSRPWSSQVIGIDVAAYQTDQTLDILTDNGYRIHWGSPPGEERPGEVPTERKLYYLDYPFESFGHIDGGYVGDLDITDPRGVFGR